MSGAGRDVGSRGASGRDVASGRASDRDPGSRGASGRDVARRLRHALEYASARTVEAAFCALPEGTARGVGRFLGGLARRPLRLRGQVVEAQLRASFPHRSEAWVERAVRGCYRHFGEELASLARHSRLRPGALVDRCVGGEGLLELHRGWAGGGGLVVVTGHLGNWELGGALSAALGIPTAAVVRSQSNRRVDRRLVGLRRALGMETVPTGQAAHRLPRILAAGGLVALVADQDARRHGLFVPFLGRLASTHRGPARLALRLGVPLGFAVLVREETIRGVDYRLRARPIWSPERGWAPDVAPWAAERGRTPEVVPPEVVTPAAASPAAERDTLERALTLAWTVCLEQEVRARPAQYFWFHRRWKTAPPDASPAGETSSSGGGSPADGTWTGREPGG